MPNQCGNKEDLPSIKFKSDLTGFYNNLRRSRLWWASDKNLRFSLKVLAQQKSFDCIVCSIVTSEHLLLRRCQFALALLTMQTKYERIGRIRIEISNDNVNKHNKSIDIENANEDPPIKSSTSTAKLRLRDIVIFVFDFGCHRRHRHQKKVCLFGARIAAAKQ